MSGGLISSFAVGFTLPYFRLLNRIAVEGEEVLRDLPRKNVVFLSNHQTYFTEAIAFYDLLYIVLDMPYDPDGLYQIPQKGLVQ